MKTKELLKLIIYKKKKNKKKNKIIIIIIIIIIIKNIYIHLIFTYQRIKKEKSFVMNLK